VGCAQNVFGNIIVGIQFLWWTSNCAKQFVFHTSDIKSLGSASDVAEAVFDRCMTTEGNDPDHEDYSISFDFELLDDVYADWKEAGISRKGNSIDLLIAFKSFTR